jgi:hypothetical protein
MRFTLHLATFCILITAFVLLKGVWESPRDLGVLSEANILNDNGAQVAALQPAQRDKLLEREISVLREQPLDVAAHRNLILLSLAPPISTHSRQLILNLSHYSLRNPAIQLAAMGVLLEAGNSDESINRVDAILRSSPELRQQIFPLIAQYFADKTSINSLIARLATNPPWRERFLIYLSGEQKLDRLTLDILQRLRSTPFPPNSNELRRVFAMWIKTSGRYERSYFVWLDQLSTSDLPLTKGVFDGEFSSEPKSLYFDWNISSSRNGRSSVVLKPGSATDRSLLVDFSGNKEAFQHVSQHLLLSPGKYVLGYDAMSKNVVAEKGLVWRVSCLVKPKLLGESPAVKSSIPWTKQSFSIEIPSDGCDTQLLRLETASRKGLDTTINGQVYYDSITINEVSSETTP